VIEESLVDMKEDLIKKREEDTLVLMIVMIEEDQRNITNLENIINQVKERTLKRERVVREDQKRKNIDTVRNTQRNIIERIHLINHHHCQLKNKKYQNNKRKRKKSSNLFNKKRSLRRVVVVQVIQVKNGLTVNHILMLMLMLMLMLILMLIKKTKIFE
jgi:hypothetical protein